MLVFYIQFGENIVPVQCRAFAEDQFISDAIRLAGVTGMGDSSLPGYKVSSLVVRKEDVKYYLYADKIQEQVEEEEEEEYEEPEEETSSLTLVEQAEDTEEEVKTATACVRCGSTEHSYRTCPERPRRQNA